MVKRRQSVRPARKAKTRTVTAADHVLPVQRAPVSLGRRFLRICLTAAAETLTEEGITPAQLGVLVNLSSVTGTPDLDQNGLAERLGVARARASQLLDETDAMGLVVRRIDRGDRRVRLLRLTPNGERLRARLQSASIDSQMRVFSSLTPHERELLFDLLVRVIEANAHLERAGGAGGPHQSATKAKTGRRSPAKKT